jgi:hypothetical protein
LAQDSQPPFMTRAPAWRCFLTTPDSGARLLALLASGHRQARRKMTVGISTFGTASPNALNCSASVLPKRMQTRRRVSVRSAGHSADGIGVVSSARVNGLMFIFAFGRTRSI